MTEHSNPVPNPSDHAVDDCFEDLAPLQALDLLSPAEQQWLEQQLADHPERAAVLAQHQAVVGALPYGLALPTAAKMQGLKAQLFERLALPPEPAAESAAPRRSELAAIMAVRSGDLRWRTGQIPKVAMAILHIDRHRRERVGLLRAEPGMQYPPHTHGGTEEIYMLSGDLVLEGVRYEAGDYIRSAPQSHHASAHSVTGCTFFFRSSLDDRYPELPA
jgi:anti-sigma factor ChrR (cupin superfamily)